MKPSIFTKIIRGEIPSYKVYEDAETFAFLDIYPVTPGHVLVIPKEQVQFVWDLDVPHYEALMAITKRIAIHLREVLGVPYIGSRIEGTDVPHAHIHLIPFTVAAEFHHVPDRTAEPNHPALQRMMQKIAL